MAFSYDSAARIDAKAARLYVDSRGTWRTIKSSAAGELV